VAKSFLRAISTRRQREVRFTGQLVHEDCNGVRLYAPRSRRLTRARAEILTSEGDEL
jgi:hypothetical protein